MKLCKDCRFLKEGVRSYGMSVCAHNYEPKGPPDYVNGGTFTHLLQNMAELPIAQDCRRNEMLCGPDAKWFEVKS